MTPDDNIEYWNRVMTNTMTYRGYVASMTLDTEDRVIVGRVLDIDDIIAFHGESIPEFEVNFHTAVDDYITACERLGGVPEKPASGKLMLRVSPSVHAAALKAAARSGTSLNKWAEEALSTASRRGSGARTQRARSEPSSKGERSRLRPSRIA